MPVRHACESRSACERNALGFVTKSRAKRLQCLAVNAALYAERRGPQPRCHPILQAIWKAEANPPDNF